MNIMFDETREKLYQADAIMQLALGSMGTQDPDLINTISSACAAVLDLVRDAIKKVDAIEMENK